MPASAQAEIDVKQVFHNGILFRYSARNNCQIEVLNRSGFGATFEYVNLGFANKRTGGFESVDNLDIRNPGAATPSGNYVARGNATQLADGSCPFRAVFQVRYEIEDKTRTRSFVIDLLR